MNEPDVLLREYVRNVLSERTTGGGVAMGDYGDALGDVFLTPFADAAKVVKGEILKLSARGQSAVLKLASGLISIVIPFVDAKFQEITKREKSKIQEIESNSEINAAWNAIKPHAKVGLQKMTFLFDPLGFITLASAASPSAALRSAAILVGPRGPKVLSLAGQKIFSQYKNSLLKGQKDEWENLLKTISSVKESRMLIEQKSGAELVKIFFDDPTVQKILASSSAIKFAQEKTRKMAQDTVSDLSEMLSAVFEAASIDEIEKITGRSVNQTSSQNLSDESGPVQQIALEQAKQAIKKEIVSKVGDHIEAMGLQDNKANPYHSTMLRAVASLVK